jgi:hypothetical protein
MADPVTRRLAAKVAANTRWSRVADRSAESRPMWSANPSQVSYWERKVDPDGTLPADQRGAMAVSARTAYMQRLAAKSKAAREARKTGGTRKGAAD